MPIRPKSIRGKLLLAFLIAVGPMMCVQVCDHVQSYLRAETTRAVRREHDASIRREKLWLAGSAAASGLGLAILFVMGNRLAHPIRRLALAAGALAVGDYRKRVSVRTGDELAALGESFNLLGESLIDHQAKMKRESEMLAGMAEAAGVASSSLDTRECGEAIAQALCTHMGATGAAVFVKDRVGGGVKPIGRHGKPPTAECRRIATHTAESGDYLVMEGKRRADPERGTQSNVLLVGIPLSVETNTTGAIVAQFEGVTRDELCLGSVRADVLTAFGVHVAAAIHNADVHSRAESYSGVLEDWVEHLSSVMQVTDAISPALNLDEALAALAKATRSAVNADTCAICLPNQHGKLVVKSFCGTSLDESSVPLGEFRPEEAETGRAFREKQYVVCSDLSKSPRSSSRAIAERTGLRSLLSAPLLVRDQPIGAITVCSAHPREFTPGEIRLLTSIGQHAAVMVRNAGLYTREASIAEALQRGLISEVPEQQWGLRFASRYIPALEEAGVGGDFYDVVRLPTGNVGVVIADVSGKGLSAAIHLAACKYMIKALMYSHPCDPARVLGELNEAMDHYFDTGFFVTVFYAVIDTKEQVIEYANAGHPPALLIREGHKMHTCLWGAGTPAGAGLACQYDSHRVDFKPSDMMLLYTDGIIDAVSEGGPLEIEGLHRLVFEAGKCSASELVAHLCENLRADPGLTQRDDMALLAVSFDEDVGTPNAVNGGRSGQKSSVTARNV